MVWALNASRSSGVTGAGSGVLSCAQWRATTAVVSASRGPTASRSIASSVSNASAVSGLTALARVRALAADMVPAATAAVVAGMWRVARAVRTSAPASAPVSWQRCRSHDRVDTAASTAAPPRASKARTAAHARASARERSSATASTWSARAASDRVAGSMPS
jgi:hypothetical protein